MATALAKSAYSRRPAFAVETRDDVWVYWRCGGMDDVSRVCDLSVGRAISVHTSSAARGRERKLDFLVPGGASRAEAVVEHLIPSGGVGLKFTARTS